jgi:hypothetical protein
MVIRERRCVSANTTGALGSATATSWPFQVSVPAQEQHLPLYRLSLGTLARSFLTLMHTYVSDKYQILIYIGLIWHLVPSL